MFVESSMGYSIGVSAVLLTSETAGSLECSGGVELVRDLVLIRGVQRALGRGERGVAPHASADLVDGRGRRPTSDTVCRRSHV